MYVLLTDFRFVGPTDERYVTGEGVWAGVTLCDGGGVKIGQKKRYVIVERPHRCELGYLVFIVFLVFKTFVKNYEIS